LAGFHQCRDLGQLQLTQNDVSLVQLAPLLVSSRWRGSEPDEYIHHSPGSLHSRIIPDTLSYDCIVLITKLFYQDDERRSIIKSLRMPDLFDQQLTVILLSDGGAGQKLPSTVAAEMPRKLSAITNVWLFVDRMLR
jgi:hypothetical protein